MAWILENDELNSDLTLLPLPVLSSLTPAEGSWLHAPGAQVDLEGPAAGLRGPSHPQHHLPLPGRPAGLRRAALHLRHRAPHQQGQQHPAPGQSALCLAPSLLLLWSLYVSLSLRERERETQTLIQSRMSPSL